MSKRQQSLSEIESSYGNPDPWGYFSNPHDQLRRDFLKSVLSKHSPSRALDIGCGNGFITKTIPASEVVGVDISKAAIDEAKLRSSDGNIDYQCRSLFELKERNLGTFDCILITGVLYGQYIGRSMPLIYRIVDHLLRNDGILISVHIDEWYFAKFPYAHIEKHRYKYRSYTHLLEVYRK